MPDIKTYINIILYDYEENSFNYCLQVLCASQLAMEGN